jgi:hypothetical protein
MQKQYIVFQLKKQCQGLENMEKEMPKTFQKIVRSI